MKKILAQVPNQIEAAFTESSHNAEKFSQVIRWVFSVFFAFAALWSWNDDTASSYIYLSLAILWSLHALVYGLRQKTHLSTGSFLPRILDFVIVSFGLILCVWQEIFNNKGFIIFLCYFPLLALLANRNNALFILQITSGVILCYAVISLTALQSLSFLRLFMLGIMGLVTFALLRKPKAELGQRINPLIAQAYAEGALEKELELTALIHAQFMPPVQHELAGLYATYKHGVGTSTSGDFYQIYDHKHGAIVLLADMAGAGLQAAFAVSELQAEITEIIKNSEDLPAIATALNSLLLQKFNGQKTMSAILAQWQGTNLHYLNAGHLPAIKISKREITRLLVNNADAFGADEEIQFRAEVMEFLKGDLLILYTDGTYSGLANNPTNGADEIERMANEFSSGEVNTICHRLFDCGQPEFARASDDSTVVVIRRQE